MCGTENSLISMVFNNEDKVLIKKSLRLKVYTAKRLTGSDLVRS